MIQQFKLSDNDISLLSIILESELPIYSKLIKNISDNFITLSDDEFLLLLDILAKTTKHDYKSYTRKVYDVIQQLIKQDKHELLNTI